MWKEESVGLAISAVSEGMSVRRAAFNFDVPKSTLHDRISGIVSIDARSGPERYLNDKEEKQIVNFIDRICQIKETNFGPCVSNRSKKRGLEEGDIVVTKGWWASFQRQHPQLSLRCAEALSYVRAIAQDPEILNSYYDLLEKTLKDNDLLNKPHMIFNCDETGFSLEHKPGKLVGMKGSTTSGDKAQMTVLACMCVTGYSMPRTVIFDRKRLKPDHTKGEIPGTIYGLSSNGWIDGELFEEWFTRHFLIHIPAI